jgi:hypothetical protein
MPKGKRCATRLEKIASRVTCQENFENYLRGDMRDTPERGAFEDLCASLVTVEPRGLRRPKGRPLT